MKRSKYIYFDEYKQFILATMGEDIKEIRIKKGISRKKLAEKINLTEQYIYNIETGKYSMSIIPFIRICFALHVTPNELLKHIV